MNLNLTTNLGMLLLGIWLIVTGLLTALSIGNPIVHVLLALLAIAAGVLIVLNR
jgi:VIT1/CCC1 family predicted Fe2+/Mn2+ transporter